MRISKTFTIEPDVNGYIEETKAGRSASDRVNQLLRRAITQEQNDRLEAEAAAFFASAPDDRNETRAFQKASLPTLGRD